MSVTVGRGAHVAGPSSGQTAPGGRFVDSGGAVTCVGAGDGAEDPRPQAAAAIEMRAMGVVVRKRTRSSVWTGNRDQGPTRSMPDIAQTLSGHNLPPAKPGWPPASEVRKALRHLLSFVSQCILLRPSPSWRCTTNAVQQELPPITLRRVTPPDPTARPRRRRSSPGVVGRGPRQSRRRLPSKPFEKRAHGHRHLQLLEVDQRGQLPRLEDGPAGVRE